MQIGARLAPVQVAMRIRLIRKLAELLDGVDVSSCEVGDIIEVTRRQANVLIAEGWVEAVTERPRLVHSSGKARPRRELAGPIASVAQAADEPRRTPRTAERLREIRQQMEQQSLGEQQRRRLEDDIREELRDSRAKTVPKKSA